MVHAVAFPSDITRFGLQSREARHRREAGFQSSVFVESRSCCFAGKLLKVTIPHKEQAHL